LGRILPQAALASRRAFLQRATLLGAAAFLQPLAGCAAAPPRFTAYPFALGVASGSPRPDGVVLWTRLAPRPLEGGGMDPQPVEVRWEVAEDEGFRRIVRTGKATAQPEASHSVHVEVEGLSPAREYHYRFIAGGETSAAARTRTSPAPGSDDVRLRIAIASCQQYEQGFFTAHRHLASEGVDLVAFLGDYIYESSWGRDHVRKHGAAEPATLEDYRNRYALYKTDVDLQASHAAAPWIVTWDDHEVDNDYATERSEELDPSFLKRRTAAYRAFLEHMPLRRSVILAGGGMRIYDRHEWGNLVRIHTLDDRQYRAWQVCPKPGRGGGNVVGADCTERLDPNRTMLGAEQERWLDEGLARSKARWNVIAQQTLMAPATQPGDKGPMHWTDGWDGYPAARQKLLDSIAQRRPGNPVVVSGDVHATYIADLHGKADRADSPVIAAEFCGTSITSQGPAAQRTEALRAANPHIRFANGTKRGYIVLDFTPRRLEAKVRTVETVKVAGSPIATLATFTVEDGRPGLQK
jgi:alkaline phosphatase D